MDQEPIHQPHDKLFKTAFSHPPTSAAFLKTQLPTPIVQAIDWPQLSLLPGSFIDSHLCHSESDLLWLQLAEVPFERILGTPMGTLVLRTLKAIVVSLQLRFSGIPDGLAEAIASVKDLERLYALQRLSLICATVDDFAREL